jgi:hypothetical protein
VPSLSASTHAPAAWRDDLLADDTRVAGASGPGRWLSDASEVNGPAMSYCGPSPLCADDADADEADTETAADHREFCSRGGIELRTEPDVSDMARS